MLPVLDARIRANKRPRDASEGQYLAGCGVLDCPGVVATVLRTDVRVGAMPLRDGTVGRYLYPPDTHVLIPAGFVETAPAHFQLGTHAAKSRRHAPRRPRTGAVDSLARMVPAYRQQPPERDEHGRAISVARKRIEGLPVYVVCPEKTCGRVNRITEAHVSAVTEAYSRQAQAVK